MKKNEIKLLAWFKNNIEWYYPDKKVFLNINNWDNYEIIHYYDDTNFLVYCWNGNDKLKQDNRLFKAERKLTLNHLE